MPALPDVPGVIKFTLNWGVDGDVHAQTVHHVKYTGTVTEASLTTFAGDEVSSTVTHFGTLATSFTGVLSCTARDLSSDMGVEVTAGPPWSGTRTGDRLSPGTAVVISSNVARHYRGGQPRSYLPLGSGTDVASTGLWADAFVTAMQTAWDDFRGDTEASTYSTFSTQKMCNVSYYGPPNRIITGSGGRVRTASTVRTVPKVDDLLTSTVRKIIGSQRRRNRDA